MEPASIYAIILIGKIPPRLDPRFEMNGPDQPTDVIQGGFLSEFDPFDSDWMIQSGKSGLYFSR